MPDRGRSWIRAPPEWGVEPVPKEARILRGIDLFVLWSSLGVGILVLQAGALMIPSLTLKQALAVSLIGSIIGSMLLAAAGVIGARHGVPTMVSLRPVFGKSGSYIATALNVLQLVGWTAFELKVMAEAAAMVAGGAKLTIAWLIAFSAFVALLAIGGPLAVVRQWLEKFAIWLVYISTAWITYQVLKAPAWAIEGGQGGMPWPLALDLVIAMPISWMPLISDYNRFSMKPSSGFAGTLLGYTAANTWFYALGAALAALAGEEFVAASILQLYMGTLALIAILVDETDNAFADVYSSAVSIQNILPKLRQWKLVLAVTVISAVLAYTLPLAEYEWFLLMIGATFVPLFGTTLSEYFIVRRGQVELDEFYEKAPRVAWRSIVSWAAGLATYFLLVKYMPNLGASLPSLAVSAALQAALGKARK
ncbi:MAG: putative hydroxymethylpyrimidine transporter CytX [Thermoproteota archaeon]|nr:MAG: putative hydroxymethylpyrimidine transporter CytX [Candidatus Korarchaeota archaeon]RLG55259.1 MAG: putative hydroxymethylpyrimidine transporter CytX [Candidatus Korarchaeota archaeon]